MAWILHNKGGRQSNRKINRILIQHQLHLQLSLAGIPRITVDCIIGNNRDGNRCHRNDSPSSKMRETGGAGTDAASCASRTPSRVFPRVIVNLRFATREPGGLRAHFSKIPKSKRVFITTLIALLPLLISRGHLRVFVSCSSSISRRGTVNANFALSVQVIFSIQKNRAGQMHEFSIQVYD